MKVVLILLLLSAGAEADEIDCADPKTTLEMNQCAVKNMETAEKRLALSVKEVGKILGADPDKAEAAKRFAKAQKDWEKALGSSCDAVYEAYSDGSARGSYFAGCRIGMMEERIHFLWDFYLEGMATDLKAPE